MKRWILIAAVSMIAWNVRSASGVDAAQTRTVADMMALGSSDFRAAIGDRSWRSQTLPGLKVDDMLKLAGRCATESPEWPKDDSGALQVFQELAWRCATQAAEPELDRVVHFMAALPSNTFQRMSAHGEPFRYIASRLLRREIAAIRAENRAPLRIELNGAAHPETTAPLPASLEEGWRRYVTVVIAADPLALRPKGVGHAPGERCPLFQRVLSGERKGIIEELARYRIVGGCMDTENVSASAGWAQWLALARERRLTEAIGVSFAERLMMDGEGARLRREFVEACGVDAAQLSAGMILATAGEWGTPPLQVGAASWQAEPDLHLLASGSKREAEMMMQIAEIVRAQPHIRVDESSDDTDTLQRFAPALGIVIARSGRELKLPQREEDDFLAGTGDQVLLKASSLAPLPQPLRARAAALLLSFLDASAPVPAIEGALDQAAGLRMKEARGAARKLLAHWSADIRKKAAITLTILGEKTREPNIAKTVVFQLVGNGGPLAHCDLDARLLNPQDRFASTHIDTFDADDTVMDVAGHGTDAKGRIAVSRSVLTDPGNLKQFTHLAFTHGPGNPWAEKGMPAPLFCVMFPLPKNLSSVTRVAVDTHPVTFRIERNRPPEFYRGKQLALTLKPLDASWEAMTSSEAPWRLPVTEDLVLPEVQAGSYAVTLQMPGAGEWQLNPLKVGKDMPRVEVKPVAATDVRFTIVLPGKNVPHVRCHFYRNGEPFRPFSFPEVNGEPDAGRHSLSGLVPGSYKVRVLSSAECYAEMGYPSDESLRKLPGYEAAELAFEIPREPPPELDLGELRLKATK